MSDVDVIMEEDGEEDQGGETEAPDGGEADDEDEETEAPDGGEDDNEPGEEGEGDGEGEGDEEPEEGEDEEAAEGEAAEEEAPAEESGEGGDENEGEGESEEAGEGEEEEGSAEGEEEGSGEAVLSMAPARTKSLTKPKKCTKKHKNYKKYTHSTGWEVIDETFLGRVIDEEDFPEEDDPHEKIVLEPFDSFDTTELIEDVELKPERPFEDDIICPESFDLWKLQPSERLEKLNEIATYTIQIDSGIDVNKYLIKVSQLMKVADRKRVTGNYEGAYVLGKRLQKLYNEELSNHPSFKNVNESSFEYEQAKASALRVNALLNAIDKRLKKVYSIQHSVYIKYEFYRRKRFQQLKKNRRRTTCEDLYASVMGCTGTNCLRKGSGDIFWCTRTNNGFPLLLFDEQMPSVDFSAIKRISINPNLISTFIRRECLIGQIPGKAKLVGYLYGMIRGTEEVVVNELVTVEQFRKGKIVMLTEEENVKKEIESKSNCKLLGWIQTKPLEFPRLSATNLHVQYALQKKNPMGFTVVCSPTYNDVAYFRLTKEGMKFIGACSRQEVNHVHSSFKQLYEEIGDFIEEDSRAPLQVQFLA